MKRAIALGLCLALLLGSFAIAEEPATSFDAETVLMPALHLQLSVPSDMRDELMNERSFLAEYDRGLRYSGRNNDLSVNIWAYNNLDLETSEEFVRRYTSDDIGYSAAAIELNGYAAYQLTREVEPGCVGYILTDESEIGVDVAYTLFFTAYTNAGASLRDELLSTIRQATF